MSSKVILNIPCGTYEKWTKIEDMRFIAELSCKHFLFNLKERLRIGSIIECPYCINKLKGDNNELGHKS